VHPGPSTAGSKPMLRDAWKRSGTISGGPSGLARVRLHMSARDADQLAASLVEVPRTAWVRRILDQLWLRSVLIEQWRRTNLAERPAFEARADRLLASLDPSASDWLSRP
jgi:hypothetical protein